MLRIRSRRRQVWSGTADIETIGVDPGVLAPVTPKSFLVEASVQPGANVTLLYYLRAQHSHEEEEELRYTALLMSDFHVRGCFYSRSKGSVTKVTRPATS